nr:uncharacterized protein LOC125968531 isoform X2 [Syngnathus scovelli]
MQSGRSLWRQKLLLTSFALWTTLWVPTSARSPPAPELGIRSWSRASVALFCRASEGHRGILFKLFRFTVEVDAVELSPTEEVLFNVHPSVTGEPELFCCMYKNQQGLYSPFSPYLSIKHPTNVSPTLAVPTLPPPVLSVDPPGGTVERGDMLSFSCSIPALPSAYSPTSFLLLWSSSNGETVSSQYHDAGVSKLESQAGVFSVGPVKRGEGGEYACIYRTATAGDIFNSTLSNKIGITVRDDLPVPTLVLQRDKQVWHMLCAGSPAYPGPVFTLYLLDRQLPVVSQQAHLTSHKITFPVPVQDTLVALYECQYSVLLGGKWSHSERSRPLAISKDVSSVDWPLILGCLSTVVLFLCSLALLVVVVLKKVKAAADEKKKRLEAKFWIEVHAKDPVVDLTLRCSSVTSQIRLLSHSRVSANSQLSDSKEWASGDTTARSPLWNSHTTFTNPIH